MGKGGMFLMIVFDQEKLNQLLKAMSRGFSRDPRQLIVFSVIVVIFIGLLLFFGVYQARKSRIKRLQIVRDRFEGMLQRYRLSAFERDLLERMSSYLRKETDKPLLLQHAATFDWAADKLRQADKIPDAAIAALRLKLGLNSQSREKVPHSSTELPRGMPLVIVQKGRKNMSGRIIKQEPYSLIIELDPGSLPPEKGMPIHVYFNNLSGLFGFSTVLLGSKNIIVRLRHSENIKRIQRREFYRKKIKLPVYVKPAGSQERPTASMFIDLGGGGASLLNPGSRYKPGEKVLLNFFPSHDSEIDLIAQVVRLSGKGRVMHLEFVSISEINRDHILGLLFKSTE